MVTAGMVGVSYSGLPLKGGFWPVGRGAPVGLPLRVASPSPVR